MPLGTLDRTPPPFFRQGLSARSKLVFFSALAVFLMVADNRLALVEPLRTALAVVLLPVQRTLAVPVELLTGGTDYLRGLAAAREDERLARERLAATALRATAAEQLARENAQLRALLDLRPALAVRAQAAEVLYEGADPFSRKVFVDRGTNHGVRPGAPVVNEDGVLGQVTRAFPLSSEVTLLADKDAAIPVLNLRTQQRSAAFGGREGGMELRFLPANADVQVGDLLHTSGLDGIYPPGLPVGTVERVERRAEAGFARVAVRLAAQADGVRHVLVLEPMAAQLPPAVAAAAGAAGAASAAAEGAAPAAASAPPPRRGATAP